MKKTLLIAAATLAAGIISVQAQVYSQNIVGYVNQTFVPGFNAIGNPLNNADGINSATNVLKGIPDFSYVYVWNGSSYNGYEIYQGQYYDQDGNNLVAVPNLPIGTGVYVQASAAFTNTYVGTVNITAGASGTITTNSVNLVSGFNFVNPSLPIGGGVTTSLGINPPDFSYVYVWDPIAQGYTGAESYQGSWYNLTGDYTVPEPTVAVGAAFFIQAASPFVWSITFTNQ